MTGDLFFRYQTSVTLVLCLSIVGAMFGAVEFGYNTGVINAPQSVRTKILSINIYLHVTVVKSEISTHSEIF